MLESTLERKIVLFVQNVGGQCWKWVSPSRTGVPDRICIFPGGKVVFVELKRPGRKDGRSPAQVKVFSILEKLGCRVWLVNDFEAFKNRLKQEGIV
ncbi:MAG: VRR-NUC domain-containing protein [Eubacterium sp.]|nr:VRR-NUC domain-containing protein [Candidatus Colimonas fimequi]